MPAARSRATPQVIRARAEYQKIPTRSKKDDPKRYSKTPHDYGDSLIRGGKLGGAIQRDIVYWISRFTVGENMGGKGDDVKRPEWAMLSLGKLAGLCQVWDDDKGRLRAVERKSIALALADLLERKIIEARDRKGCGPTTTKMYKLTPEHWEKAPPYRPPTPRELDEAEAIAEEEDEEAETVQADAGTEEIVEPGKNSRPARFQLAAPTATIRVTYRSDFSFPVRFRATAGSNGSLHVTAAPHGEQEANNCSHAQPQRAKLSEEKKRFIDFEDAATRVTLANWSKLADAALVNSIVEAAGPDTPVWMFEQICNGRLLKKRKQDTSGLLIHLAKEARERFEREEMASTEAQKRLDASLKQMAPTPGERAIAARERALRQQEYVKKQSQCPGCEGSGRRHVGPVSWGVTKNCGLCGGSGERAPV